MDFGCGGGIDVILAARKVGEQGRVVGLDFAPEMIERAKQAVAESGLQDRNIELRVAGMENSKLPSDSSNVIISNCVINLCPDKDPVYEEAFRVLRPGGRLAISDIVLTEDIHPQLRGRFQTNWAGCLGGSIPEDDYWRILKKTGFREVQIVARHILTSKELEAMACCPGEEFTPAPAKEDLAVVQGIVTSIKFSAIKPSL